MRFQKVIKRVSAFSMALLLMVFAPIGNYFQARDVAVVYASASGVTSTVLNWIWSILLAMCGVTVDDERAIESISSGFVKWLQDSSKTSVLAIVLKFSSYGWGQLINNTDEVVQALKEYFQGQDGYATAGGLSPIRYGMFNESFSARYGFDVSKYTSSDRYLFSVSQDFRKNRFWDVFLPAGITLGAHNVAVEYNSGSTTTFRVVCSTADGAKVITYTYLEFLNGEFQKASTVTGEWTVENLRDSLAYGPIPAFSNSNCYGTGWISQKTLDYFATGDTSKASYPVIDSGENVQNIELQVTSKQDIQSRPIQQVGELRVPATMEEAHAQYIQIAAADTAQEIVTALSPTIDVVYGDAAAGEDDKAYPWVPDITGALGAIKDVITGLASPLTGIEKLLMDIPGKLADIYSGVISIPEQIAAFFTIDTAQINAAQVELVAAFKAKFPALYGLSDIFNFSRQFTDTIPVISIPVPDFLKFAYPNEDRIIIFDLTAYKEWFDFCRNIISAILWIAFIRWLLEQFDVKFGVN